MYEIKILLYSALQLELAVGIPKGNLYFVDITFGPLYHQSIKVINNHTYTTVAYRPLQNVSFSGKKKYLPHLSDIAFPLMQFLMEEVM